MNPEVLTPDEELENYKLHRRFDRIGRLVGDDGMRKLFDSHVTVVGLGGVGSYAAEMLARSGVGALRLIDFDEVCITNFNRQIHALGGNVGKHKATLMAERLAMISPRIECEPLVKFYSAQDEAALELLRGWRGRVKTDFVVDAIDSITSKCHLIATCVKQGIPIITSTGSGGRLDPTKIEVKDLALTQVDPLARELRRILREKYSFPREEGVPFGVPCVVSTEPVMMPKELTYDGGKGFRCVCPQKDNPYFTCENRNIIMGNAGFVTASFGMACASYVVRKLI